MKNNSIVLVMLMCTLTCIIDDYYPALKTSKHYRTLYLYLTRRCIDGTIEKGVVIPAIYLESFLKLIDHLKILISVYPNNAAQKELKTVLNRLKEITAM